MDRATEQRLAKEIFALQKTKSAFLDDHVTANRTEHYVSETRFAAEREKLFRRLPVVVAHVSELSGVGAFLRREAGGLPLLLTRNEDGRVNAFLNVCRHRGARLVSEASGCKRRISCPYHAWTYDSNGRLVGAPHFDEGFAGLDKASLGLRRVQCAERFGFVWVWGDHEIDIDAYFEGLSDELEALDIGAMSIAAEDAQMRPVNWKILVEGGIEAYHFRVAHRTTIGPHFEDNLSTYQSFGAHMRAVLPRTSLRSAQDMTSEGWRLRDHANILYTLFPTTQLLVLQDHIVWTSVEPASPGETLTRIVTLAPSSGPLAQGKDQNHWTQNHQITMETLEEDFALGVGIQAGVSSGANEDSIFGRFEGALDQFNRTIDAFVKA